MTRKLRLVAVVAVVFAAVAGCDNFAETQGAGDAPITRTEDIGWVVLNGADHFSNIAHRCFGPNGLYVPRNPSNDASRNLVVLPNDPVCAEGRR